MGQAPCASRVFIRRIGALTSGVTAFRAGSVANALSPARRNPSNMSGSMRRAGGAPGLIYARDGHNDSVQRNDNLNGMVHMRRHDVPRL